jgi:penicillin-binding protein 1A
MGLFRPRSRQDAHSAPAGSRPRRHGIWRRLFRRLPWEIRLSMLAPIYLGIPACIGIAFALIYYTVAIPDPRALRQKERPPIVRILDRNGAVLAERGGAEAYVSLDALPQHLIDAVVATEDRRFFEHWGLDPAGLARAVLANLQAGRVVQGGSTLTQQLAKNLFLSSTRTFGRKLEELVLALWLEVRLGKRDVLEIYLNRVYFGGAAYGVETAAQRFFGKPASALTLQPGSGASARSPCDWQDGRGRPAHHQRGRGGRAQPHSLRRHPAPARDHRLRVRRRRRARAPAGIGRH